MDQSPAPPVAPAGGPGAPVGHPGAVAVRFDLARLRSFSDCVFAVAITLLAVVAAVPARGSTPAQVDDFLSKQLVGYGAFVGAFLIIGYVWLQHHRIFGLLHRVDGRTAFLNFALLAVVLLLPYLGRLAADFHALRAPHVLVGADVTLIGLLLMALIHRCRRAALFDPVVPDRAVDILGWRARILAAAFGCAAVLAVAFPTAMSLGWPLLILGGIVLRWRVGRLDQADVASMDDLDDLDDLVGVDADEAPVGDRPGHRQLASLGRITGFSDNVYAFAITVLVLQLHVPELTSVHTDGQLVSYLWHSADPSLTGYLLGFVIIGSYWVVHCRYFLLIDRHSPALPAINLGHLMTVAVLPFATLLFSDFPLAATTTVYAVAAGLTGVSLCVVLVYAVRRHLTGDTLDPEETRRAVWQSALMPLGFLLSVPVALVAPRVAWVIWLLVGVSRRRLVRSRT